MFERFTERGRAVVVEAQNEARRRRNDTVRPYHLLVGLLAEGEGIACRVLESCGFTIEQLRERLEPYVGASEAPAGQIPFHDSATKALELALREALSLGHNHIGTEHILLGLCRLDEPALFRRAEVEKLRAETIRILSGSRRSERKATRGRAPVVTRPRCLAGFSLYGASFHCQSDLDHDPADGHVEYGDGWTMRWSSE